MPFNSLQENRKVLPEIAMRRTVKKYLCGLIVEGITDRKFFEKFIATDQCAVFSVNGRPQVVATITEASTANFPGVLGVIDGDTDLFLGKPKPTGNLLRTDKADIESLMFASPAFVHLFRDIVLRERDQRSGENIASLAESTRMRIVGAAFQIGLMRCAAAQSDMKIKFSDLAYNTFVNKLTCVIDVEACVQAVVALPRGGRFSDDDVRLAIATLLETHSAHDKWDVVRGHDLTRIAAICSETLLSRKLDRAEVEQGLRLAYDAEEFRQTLLYSDIAEWSERNKPFVVWKAPLTRQENQSSQ